MNPPRCLYTVLHAPHERIEPLLMERVAPVLRDLRDARELDSFFFVRYSDPRWQLRVRIFGEPDWIEGPVRRRFEACVAEWARAGEIEDHLFARYDREIDRYGGEEGMALAEQLFFIDSCAALEILEAERQGQLAKSRRELSMVLVERLIDVARFDRAQRLAFYRQGHAWATETTEWDAADRETLEARFRRLRPGLEALLFSDPPQDDATSFGGPIAAEIAHRFLDAAAPVVERIVAGHREGRIRQDLAYLFWSYAHMFTNRLGIESAAEAILRYFVHRLYEERRTIGV